MIKVVGFSIDKNEREACRNTQTVAKLGFHTKTSQEKSNIGQPQTIPIFEMIQNSQVHFHDMGSLIPSAWAIIGVLLEKSVHLGKWSTHRAGEAQAVGK